MNSPKPCPDCGRPPTLEHNRWRVCLVCNNCYEPGSGHYFSVPIMDIREHAIAKYKAELIQDWNDWAEERGVS